MTKPFVLILSARSDIGKAVAHKFSSFGYSIQLAARNAASLEADQANIELQHGDAVSLHKFDALAIDTHEAFVKALPELSQVAVCAAGLMGVQAENERDIENAANLVCSNYEGPASILAVLANHFEARGCGTLVGISSVAGERGRATNYVYGSAKAGLTAFLSGLRNRFSKHGVHVVTVLPVFDATQMTKGMDLPAKLTAQPSDVASASAHAVERTKDLIYARPICQLILSVIKNIPEMIFKRLRI